MEEQEKSIQDYLAVLSRRKAAIIATGLVVFLLGLITALVWPPTYRSSATILIKEQEIPTELVRSTVTSFAAQRIQTISQSVMTRPNLMEIVEKYKLYVKERKRNTTEEVLEEMRDDIGLNMISADVMDPRTGRPGVATIAFKLSYEGSDPDSTQKVAGELTSLFLAENLKTRKDKAAETYSFLTDETSKLEDKIAESGKKLAEFKEKNAHSLPEMSAMNLSMLNRTESELDSVDAELRALKERKFYLQSQLDQINPLTNMRSATGQSILDPVSRLKALESEFASLSTKYSDKHPDIVKIKREIAGLRQTTGHGINLQEHAIKLTQKRSEYALVKEKYSVSHPDVIKLESEIVVLEKLIADNPMKIEKGVMKLQPDNPAYITVQTQLKTVETEITSNSSRKKRLDKKLLDLEERISKSPQVEKEFMVLTREQQSALSRFQDIKARQMEAEIGQELEKESKGESFLLIDPAQFPEKPVKPNRVAIVFLSLIFSIAAGLGVAILKEAMDGSVRGVASIHKILTAAPLAVIPIIYNTYDLRHKQRTNQLIIGSVVGSIISVMLLIHFFWTPLDVLWFRGLRKAENVMDL
ncbi:MAG: lipopolysaccharide biosynthesis protein [endosymbiont of Galathealinum brachiosum]|uniref:Lipopolysaccharide biosynthesis protein n=1 Tax=endosymbiont of Galathealinum brachiosum TaxID=2200906 RepID=A0A370D8Y4_9GAMM|nr:MAG: lipopolysaccharide biosynthesis protein [endosymbiont of Galathealinum brachiosum]